jgi:hypothetical protein
VTATDGAGNLGSDATANELTIDTTAPTVTVNLLTTNDTTPQLTGTVNDNTATIQVTVNGNNYAATNNGDGTWTLADNTIAPALAEGVWEVAVTATDAASNVGADATANELTIDTTAPTVTVNLLTTNDTTPELTGTVDDTAATIQVTVNGNNYAATNNGDGTWTLADNTIAPALAEGVWEVAVTATDGAGNVGSDGTTNELTVDTTASTVTVNVLNTSDTTPALTGTVDDTAATIQVTVNGSNYAATNNGDGTWTLADNTIAPALAEGVWEVAVTATDAASNVGADPTANELTVDTTAPTVTVNVLNTSDTTPALSGTVDDNTATIQVTVNGSSYAATNNGDGTWTLADNTIAPALAEGIWEVAVTATDGAGNVGADVTTNELTVDSNDAPTAITLDSSLVNENAIASVIGNLSTTDPDAGDTHTYTVDDARFEVVAGQLKLKAGQSLDFEAEPTVDITVTSTDAGLLSTDQLFTITVVNVNDPPVVSATGSDTGAEDTDKVYTHAQMLALIGAADVDDVDADLYISISNVVNGSVTHSGGLGDVGTTFTFTPNPNFAGNMTFDYLLSDDDLAVSAMGTATVSLTPVNDAPTATNMNTAETLTNTSAVDLTDIIVSDVDNVNVTVTLTLSDPSAGSLSTGTSGAVTSTYDGVTGLWTASGAVADVNNLLAGVTFRSALDYHGSFTIATKVDDGAGATITGIKNMIGTPPGDTSNEEKPDDGDDDSPPDPVDASDDNEDLEDNPSDETPEEKRDRLHFLSVQNRSGTPKPASPEQTTERKDDALVTEREETDGDNHKDREPSELARTEAVDLLQAKGDLYASVEMSQNQIQSIDRQRVIFRKAFVGTTLSLTAGVATWALRIGSLVASAITSMPLWKVFDPLPVLPLSRKKRRERLKEIRASEEEERRKDKEVTDLLDTTKGDHPRHRTEDDPS